MTREEAIKILKEIEYPANGDNWEYRDTAFNMAIQALSTEPCMKNDKCVAYKNVAIELLEEYLRSAEVVISEYSVDFKKSALELKEKALRFLERLDEGEDTFNELVKNMWLSDHYDEESEDVE